jgi:hypothetical protein
MDRSFSQEIMTNNFPITPPPELVRQWAQYHDLQDVEALWRTIATQAARWGADMELEACIDVLSGQVEWDLISNCTGWKEFRDLAEEILSSARRPKPPSLKELALEAQQRMWNTPTLSDWNLIRRALEALPND